jgi:hypothetical protein
MERLELLDDFVREDFVNALRGEAGTDIGFALREIECRFADERPKMATRQASQQVLEAITQVAPNLLGGSADLTHSNLTLTRAQQPVRPGAYGGTYIHYGIREHAMAAAMNGVALHGGFIPYGGTFLAFSDYSRPAIRLAALMGMRVIHVMTMIRSGSAKTDRRISRSSIWPPCAPFPISWCFARRMRSKPRRPGTAPCAQRGSLRCCACRDRRCPCSIARSPPKIRSRAAPMW